MKTLILIDVSQIFRAHWHSTEHQEIGEAFSRTVAQVHRLRQGYDLCAVCCDSPPYRRKELSAAYKAQRDAPPPQLVEQMRRTKERLAADGLLIWESPGYEADDVIAWATRCAVAEELTVRIASGDKDLLALVNDAAGVSVFSPISQKTYDEPAVLEKCGVPPFKIRDWLALVGDTSDNIPGVPGVGPKTAAKLLADFGDLETLIANAAKVPGKVGENLRANIDAARLAKRLVTLETDVPLDFDQLFVERAVQPLVEPPPMTEDDMQDDDAPDETGDDMGLLSAPPPKTENAQQQQAQEPKSPESPKTALVVRDPTQAIQLAAKPVEWTMALEPTNTKEAFTMAGYLFNSRLFAKYGNQEACFAVLLRGRSLGLDAVTSLANFHVIEGQPAMHAALIVGLVLRSGKAQYFQLIESTDDRATWETHRVGNPKPVSMSFSIDDAFRAGLVERHGNGYRGVSKSGRSSNWDKYRRTMLRWRAATELARSVYPDVTTGLFTPDEVSEGRHNEELE